MSSSEPKWVFGSEPLSQSLTLAPLLRSLMGSVLSLEYADAAVDRLIADLQAVTLSLSPRLPVDPAPRIGPASRSDQRVYVDHSRSIGAYNACFPEYEIEVDGERARGTVCFPLAYEGPPGIVHGGFLALFFDCVVQHHNCDVGVTGKTLSLSVSYQRPAPLLQKLEFEIERSATARRIISQAQLSLDGAPLCRATMEAIAGERSRLPQVSPRRSRP